MKKIVLTVMLAGLIASPMIFHPEKAVATGAPVVDVAHIGIQTGNFFVEAGRWAVDKALTTLLAAAKKRMLDLIVDQTIAWIQGNGQPQFVTDRKAFFANIANVVVGDFVQEIGAGRICQPFKVPIQQINVLESRPFSSRAACTLNQIVDNIEDFYNDFAQGGWIAYREALKPQNNIYGAYLLAEEEKEKRLAAELSAAADEVAAGGGFLSQKRCLFWSRINPAGQLETRADNGLNQPPDNSLAPNNWKCTQAEIVTPGRTVGDLAAKAIGSDIDFLVNAEDISAYTAAIVDAAISRLTRETYNGLLGARLPTININEAIQTEDNTGCSGLTGRQRELCLSGNTERSGQERAQRTLNNELLNGFDRQMVQLQSNLAGQENRLAALEEANETLIGKIDAFKAAYENMTEGQKQENMDNTSIVGQIEKRAKTDFPGLQERISGIKDEADELENQRQEADLPELEADDLLQQTVQYLLQTLSPINEAYLGLKNDIDSMATSIPYDNQTMDGILEDLANQGLGPL